MTCTTCNDTGYLPKTMQTTIELVGPYCSCPQGMRLADPGLYAALGASPTGRLPDEQPNMQNIPIRTPEGTQIKRAFADWMDHVRRKK